MRTMHLFAGIGGGLLADLILGHTPIVAVEWGAYACKVLRERAADGWFPDLSVWEGDVRLFDPSEYAGKVDCINAGFPCTDLSVAGNQAGIGVETRSGLYREVIRIASIVRPKYIFLENVSAILSGGLEYVLSDLAAMGFDAEWCCLRASDVGAGHSRDRWWLLATDRSIGECEFCGYEFDVDRLGRYGCPNCEGDGLDSNSEDYGLRDSIDAEDEEDSIGRELAQVPTARGVAFDAERFISKVRAAEFIRGGNDVPTRVHQIRGLGNAQVPLQAATAYRLLGGE
jgi:DNA (cytosine-5)-methyltransferase 1